jgi:GT2 family glycosyltransferase
MVEVADEWVVLIPAFNAAATISETLESLGKQTLSKSRNIRVILADDASQDNTISVTQQAWHSDWGTLEIWRADKNGGERRTVNRAFDRLRTEGVKWCWVLHADDVAKPDWAESLLTVAQTHLEAASICSSWDNWFPSKGAIHPGEENPKRSPEVILGDLNSASGTLGRGCWWHFSGCMMNLGAFAQVGNFDEEMPQLGDIDWLVRCHLTGLSVVYLPRSLILYRNLASSVSGVSFRTNRDLREAWRIVQRFRGTKGIEAGIRSQVKSRQWQAVRRMLQAFSKGKFKVGLEALKLAFQFATTSIP